MNILEKYLALDRQFIIDQLKLSLSLKDFWKRCEIDNGLRSNRGRKIFESKFGIDILSQIKLNLVNQKEIEKQKLFSQIRICKNPKCNKTFSWNERPYSDFCSDECAHSYSSGFVNPKNISSGMKTSITFKLACIKNRKLYQCQQCSKNFYFSESTSMNCKRQFCSQRCYEEFKKQNPNKKPLGGKRHGSGRGKKGWYKGYWCDSTWELVWIIYQLEHNIKFTRYTSWFPYEFKEQKRKYYPDFLLDNGTFVEIKGYNSNEWQAKLKSFPKDKKLIVYYKEDLQQMFEYVTQKYGKDLTKLYESHV